MEAWLAVNKNGTEIVSPTKPIFDGFEWYTETTTYMECQVFEIDYTITLPRGSIKRLIGRELAYTDDPVCVADE